MDVAERFRAKVDKTGKCWNWTCGLLKGYGQFSFNGTNVSSHRYSYILHHPLTIDLWEHREICVCHTCDNRKCVNPSHLWLGSNADNNKDRVEKGRDAKGENNGQTKLTEEQVREIIIKYENGGITHQQLGLEYGVSRRTIGDIINRKTWNHLE